MRPSDATVRLARKTGSSILALTLFVGVLVMPGIPAEAAPDETFADDFQSYSFSGSTGSLPWVGPWSELGEADGAGAGAIRVDDEPNCVDEPCLLLGRDAGPDASVEREVDLSSFESASLTFDYKVHRHPPGGGSAELSVSDDGGGSWVALDSWPLGTNTGDLIGSYDLTPYLASNARIRFAVTDNSSDSHMNIDNLIVTGSDVPVFYTVAGSGGAGGGDDLLTAVGSTDSDSATNEISIGIGTGSSGIQAAAWQPSTGILYAVDAGQLGTIDLATGAFVAKPSAVGTGNGSQGSVSMDDVVGLTFDPATGDLYGAQRRSFTEALLMVIDPATGAIRTGVFGGDDYIQIQPNGLNFQVTDLAFDPTTGQAYVIHLSEILRTFVLSTLDPSSGTTNGIGSVPDDIRSLDFDAAGRLWATTATGTVPEQLHELNKTSGASLSSIGLDNGADYEALAIPRSAPVNEPPGFDQDLTDRSDPEGTLVTISASATDPNLGDTLTYSATGLPQGISIDPTSGDIGGVLGPNSQGLHPVTITVTDDGDPLLADNDNFDWTVDTGEPTYLIAAEGGGPGNEALLTAVNRSDGNPATNELTIGTGLGRTNAEGASIQPGSNALFASHRGQLGTVDVTTGVFSALPSLAGTGNGSAGVETFDNIEALSFDPASGDLHAIHQPGGSEAMLLELNPATGAHVPNVFGGDDYIVVQSQGPHDRVPGMAYDPTDGTLYVVHWDNDGLDDWDLATLDPATGATTRIGPLPDDLTGLSFTRDGRLFGITDEPSGGTLYQIDKTDGSVDSSITVDNTDEYEAIAIAYPQLPNMSPVFDQDLLDRADPEGTLIDVSASATDPNLADTLIYVATGLPDGVMIDPATGTISGALGPNSAGVYSVTITVTDNGSPGLQDTDVFTWTIGPGQVTYLVANTGGGNGGDDLLTAANLSDPDPSTNEVDIGTGTGTTNIEAAALQPGTNVLFAVENDQLGIIDVTSGVFSPRPSIAGVGNGTAGLIALNNIEGLSFDPFTGELYGTHRRGLGEEDLLFKFDAATGSHIPNAFSGDDYTVIEKHWPYHHAADLAFDPTNGQAYIVHWDVAGNWTIATLDPITGATVTLGVAPDDIASLAFSEGGRLYTSTDTGGTETLFELDKADGSTLDSIVIDNESNYEAMAIAFPVDPNQPPVFNQDLLDRTDPEGTSISLSAAAIDPQGQDVAYSAIGLPPGLTIDPGSGLISGTIDFDATGDYPVEISVVDDGIPNLGATDTFTWTVSEVNRPPAFDQDLLDRTDPEGSPISLSASATDPDAGDNITYGATGLPPGLTIDPGSGLISGTIDYTAAAGSPHAVTITATDDGAPPAGALPDTFTWTVSNTNRAPVIVNPGPQTTPELAPFSIVITATDPDGTTPSFTDSGTLPAWAVLTDNLDGTATIAGTPGGGDSGTTTVTVTASDGSLGDDAVFDLTVTNTNQAPSITNPGNQFGAEGSPFSLVISASDPDGTTVGFSDGATLPPWATLTDNGDDTATITGTPGYADSGTTTVTVTASDGSLTDVAVFDISILDTNRAPTVDPITDQTVAEGDLLTPVTVTASDPDGTTPTLAQTGLPLWATFIDNGDGTATITGTPGYTDAATSTVTITASDGSLTGDTTFQFTVTNTNRAPTVDPIADQSVAENDPFALVVTSSDPDGTIPSLAATGLPGWATFVDNGDGTATITGTPGYTDAAIHTITINVEDGGAPNLSDTTNFQLTVTNTNRAPTVDSVADQSVAENDPFALALAASDPDGTTPALTQAGLPGWATFIDNGDGTATITGTPGYTDAATSTITITASDGSLTGDAVFDLTVTNTNRPPVADPVADQTVAEGTALTPLVVSGSDPDGTIPALTQAGLPGWATFVDNGDGTATITGTPSYTDAATSTVTITASDGSLTGDTVFNLTVTNTNRPPVAAGLPNQTDAEGATVSLASGGTDPDLDDLSYSATGLPPGLTIDPASGLISGTIGFAASPGSPYTVEITLVDDGTPALTATDSFTWTVTNTNRPPVFDGNLPDRTDPEGTTVSVSAAATDPDLDTVTYSATGLPPGLTIDPASGLISGTIAATAASTYPVAITATDDGTPTLDTIDRFTWTVTDTNRPPQLQPIADQLGPEEALIRFTASASDPDLDSIVFSLSGQPTGAAIDPATGVFTWTPTEADGTGSFAVTVTATDTGTPALTDSKVVTITVQEVNRPPTISPIADQINAVDSAITLVVEASDPDIPANGLVFSASGLPGGLAIDPSTGVISGVTAPGSVGTHTVEITVDDGGTPAGVARVEFQWKVTDKNRPPIMHSIPDETVDEEDLIWFTTSGYDPDGHALTFSLSGEPTGATIDRATGEFNWKPSEEQGPATYRFTVIATDSGSPRLTASTQVTISVLEVNEAPEIGTIADQSSEFGDSVFVRVEAADPDLPANELTFSVDGLPEGLSINSSTGIITGVIADTATGEHQITVEVTDSGSPMARASTEFTWTVADVEEDDDAEVVEPPAIDPVAEQYSEEGETVSLQISASGSGPLSYTAAGLPPGLSIDETSGLTSGTIGEDTAGSHHVTVTVVDDGPTGSSGTTTFFWVVTDVAAAEQKEDLVGALDGFAQPSPTGPEDEESEARPIRRTLVVMGGVAGATTEALSMPFALLLILLIGFVTMGRIGLYPLLWRGDRHRGTITFFDQEKNFGLVEPDGDGEAVFVHAHAFPRRQRATLQTGVRVRYRLLASDNRANAWGATTEGTNG